MSDDVRKNWWEKLKADVTASLKGKAEADGQIAKDKGEVAPVIDVSGYAEAVVKGMEASLEARFAALEGAQFAKSADVVSKAQLDEAVSRIQQLEAVAKAATDAANAATDELVSLRNGLPGRGNTNPIKYIEVSKGGTPDQIVGAGVFDAPMFNGGGR